MLPFLEQWIRLAVVPGPTPFLLSSTFLKQIQAVIDTEQGTMYSKVLKKHLHMDQSPKNLFLMGLNQLWTNLMEASEHAQTFAADFNVKTEVSESGSLQSEGFDHHVRHATCPKSSSNTRLAATA